MDEYVQALLTEISLQPTSKEPIETIYFGGGTPGILPVSSIQSILKNLHQKFPISQSAEVTLEANPENISAQQLSQWHAIGINRLSLGIQSFNDAELAWMNRTHNAQESVQCLELLSKSPIKNFSIDLIYGSALSTVEDLKTALNIIQHYKVPHVSAYALTVEEKTALAYQVHKGKFAHPDQDVQAAHFEFIQQALKELGYEHYEISNWALPGFRSRHNTSYWQGKKYLGLGASAHAFDGNQTRKWNVSNNALYIQSLKNNIIPAEVEELTLTQCMNEFIMIRLRTCEGIPLLNFKEKFGNAYFQTFLAQAQKFIQNGYLINENENLKLTPKGIFLADGIAADLFF